MLWLLRILSSAYGHADPAWERWLGGLGPAKLAVAAAGRGVALLLPDALLHYYGGGLRLPVLPVVALCRLPRRDLTALLSLGQQLRAIDFAPFRRSVLSKRSVQAWLES